MILFGLGKGKDWKWWMRFKKPSIVFDSFGCRNDSHISWYDPTIEAEVCMCDLGVKRRKLYNEGYKQVGTWFPVFGATLVITRVLSDGEHVAYEHHECGR